jgi:hypothetical protein
MPFPKLFRNTSNQATRRANTLRKVGSEDLTLGDDRAHKIGSRIQNTRTAHFEMDFKTLIKKLGNREKIVPQRLDHEQRNVQQTHHAQTQHAYHLLYVVDHLEA